MHHSMHMLATCIIFSWLFIMARHCPIEQRWPHHYPMGFAFLLNGQRICGRGPHMPLSPFAQSCSSSRQHLHQCSHCSGALASDVWIPQLFLLADHWGLPRPVSPLPLGGGEGRVGLAACVQLLAGVPDRVRLSDCGYFGQVWGLVRGFGCAWAGAPVRVCPSGVPVRVSSFMHMWGWLCGYWCV